MSFRKQYSTAVQKNFKNKNQSRAASTAAATTNKRMINNVLELSSDDEDLQTRYERLSETLSASSSSSSLNIIEIDDLLLSCTFCQQQFLNQSELDEHIVNNHNNNLKRLAPTASRRSQRQSSRPKHKKTYECLDCKKPFRYLTALKEHRRDDGDNQDSNLCSVARQNIANGRGHGAAVAAPADDALNDKPFKCDKCNKVFKFQNNLELHKQIHEIENTIKCKKCGKTFKTFYWLKMHYVEFPNHIG